MINLENKDCFEYVDHLQKESIGLVLIDPPYIISRDTGFKTGGGDKRFEILDYQFGDWDQNEINLQKLFKTIYPKMKKSSTIIVFYDLWKISYLKCWIEEAGFRKIRFAEWLKTNPVPVNSSCGYLSNCREVLITATKGKGVFLSKYDKGVYNYPICNDKGRFHPTQKPESLIKDLILKHSNQDDSILDCFSGSGTTAKVAKDLGRDFFGCEINKEYYDKSKVRLDGIYEFGKVY